MTDVYVYLRVSTDDKGQDPKNQEVSCLKLIDDLELGDNPVLFIEERSAWQSYRRPVFERMLKQARDNNVKNIVCWDYDRIYRDRKKLLELVGTYKKFHGIRIYSYRQKFMEDLLRMDGSIGELMYDVMLNFFGWIAEEESRKKSERVKEAYKRKKSRSAGKVNWGRPSISDYQLKRLKELRGEGKSYREIAEDMQIKKSTVAKYCKELSIN